MGAGPHPSQEARRSDGIKSLATGRGQNAGKIPVVCYCNAKQSKARQSRAEQSRGQLAPKAKETLMPGSIFRQAPGENHVCLEAHSGNTEKNTDSVNPSFTRNGSKKRVQRGFPDSRKSPSLGNSYCNTFRLQHKSSMSMLILRCVFEGWCHQLM